MDPFNRPLLALAALSAATAIAVGLVWPLDLPLTASLDATRRSSPATSDLLALITFFGSAVFLVPLCLGTAGVMAMMGRRQAALVVAAVPLSGRLAIELIKLIVDRPRPDFSPHPVYTHSASFPSGHAGNTMMTFLTLALLLAPARWRGWAVAGAIAASLLVGATRPVLGVHWVSDVAAGWALGIAWVVGGIRLFRRAA